MTESDARAVHEIEHGAFLSQQDAEAIWGWGTPAGRRRAARRASLVVQAAHLRRGIRVLEIGCGTGNFTELFARTGAEILAVDISPHLIRQARARRLPHDQVTFLEARFEDCAITDPFDAVIGSSVLHHLDVEAAIPRIFELLKPGATMSFAEPNLLNPQVYLERKLHFLPIFRYTSPDEIAFVRWRLARKLRSCGFEHVRITPFDWLHPFTPGRLIRPVERIGRTLERTPLLREWAGSLHVVATRP